jgi:hypothetical protein
MLDRNDPTSSRVVDEQGRLVVELTRPPLCRYISVCP